MNTLNSYLELGLIALGRGGQTNWFNGHFGAALLAAYYMNQEQGLPAHVQEGLIRTCENYRASHADWFIPYENETADPELLDQVISGLRANTQRLSSSGHGLALGVLGLKALLDRPDLCTPGIIDGIVKMLNLTSQDRPNRYFGIADYFTVTPKQVTDIPVYQNATDMVRAAFAPLQVVVPNGYFQEQHYFFTGEAEHALTHAHAILELERLGYFDLAQQAMINHRIQVYLNTRQPEEVKANAIEQPTFSSIFSEDYWAGTYGDPHAIKVPYAALPLLKYLPEAERTEAERNTCKILCQAK